MTFRKTTQVQELVAILNSGKVFHEVQTSAGFGKLTNRQIPRTPYLTLMTMFFYSSHSVEAECVMFVKIIFSLTSCPPQTEQEPLKQTPWNGKKNIEFNSKKRTEYIKSTKSNKICHKSRGRSALLTTRVHNKARSTP